MTKRKRREVAGDSCCGTEKGRGQQCWEGRGSGADGAGVSEAGTRESRLLGSEGQAARLSGLLAKTWSPPMYLGLDTCPRLGPAPPGCTPLSELAGAVS